LRILHIEPERFSEENRESLESLGDTHYKECKNQEDVIAALGASSYEALFCKIGIMLDKSVFGASPSLKYIITPTTGLTHIDLEEAGKRNIRVISLKGDLDVLRTVTSTAELAFGLAIAAARKIVEAHDHVMSGKWDKGRFVGPDLRGRTFGILGFGRLGQMVAGYALAFQMTVLACDNNNDVFNNAVSRIKPSTFDGVLERSDFISLHLPLEVSTHKIISREKVEKIKPGAILINTARGELVDESAVVAGLRSGRIRMYASDVLTGDGAWDQKIPEGFPPIYEYAKEGHGNVILTPHMGGLGQDSINRTRAWIVHKFKHLMEHGTFPSAKEWIRGLDTDEHRF
jgi:D-3-phosphoglycerate dehydrogenase / 2-oxoglutarate reductase